MNERNKEQAIANLMQAFQDYFAAGLTFELGVNCEQIKKHTCQDCEGNYSDCCLREVQMTFDNMKDLKNAQLNADPSHGNAFVEFNRLY